VIVGMSPDTCREMKAFALIAMLALAEGARIRSDVVSNARPHYASAAGVASLVEVAKTSEQGNTSGMFPFKTRSTMLPMLNSGSALSLGGPPAMRAGRVFMNVNRKEQQHGRRQHGRARQHVMQAYAPPGMGAATPPELAVAPAPDGAKPDLSATRQRVFKAMARKPQAEGKRRVARSRISMKAGTATPKPAPEPLGAANVIAGLVWGGLVAWSFTSAPGPFPDPIGPQLVATLAAQPVPRPESINEIFYAVFNSFSVVAAAIAALTLPSGGKLEADKLKAAPTALASWIPAGQRLPAIPFLWGSVVIGYFALGPYFALRSARPGPLDIESEVGWCTRNIFEQRAFGVVLSALALSLPFSSDLLSPAVDYAAVASAFWELLLSSRFVAVASVDIVLMLVLAATLIKEDCGRRGWSERGLALGAGSLLLPILGPCLYLAVRPPLVEEAP